jgi:hypothetical protein
MIVGTTFRAMSQDEGVIVKKERIDRDKGIFIGVGPSWTLGKNIGDYSAGINFELGYTKRLNRVLSIGPSLSYLSFEYDPDKTEYNNAFAGGPFQDSNGDYYYTGLYLDLRGGDLSLVSLAINLKLNLIPIRDNSIVSVYAFVKPFVTYASRTEVKGDGIILANYGDPGNSADWLTITDPFSWEAGTSIDDDNGLRVSDKLKEKNQVTGGVFLGPGIEFFPARKFSAFLQVAIGYTFPVSFISTKSYDNDQNYGDDVIGFLESMQDYPIKKEGFPSVNLQLGLSFNF